MNFMKNTVKFLLIAAVGSLLVGCYNDFDVPAPAHIWTASDFEEQGLEFISPADLKARFKSETGNAGDGAVSSWTVKDDLYTSGKVISNDRYNNVYKSMYIYDPASQSAIEVRLTNGNYISHPVGQVVYVKLKGLTLGNYRGMVSIGRAYNKADKKYANATIELKNMLKAHIFSGEQVGMAVGDTLVVNSTNYATLLSPTSGTSDAALARLVRFENIPSKFGQALWGYKNNFPNYFADADHTYDITSGEPWATLCQSGNATWADKRKIVGLNGTTSLYGSCWFTYNPDDAGDISGTRNAPAGNYVVRTSAYSAFWNKKITEDGKSVDLTAIYTKFTGGTGTTVTYQLTLNSDEDVKPKN